MTDDRLYFRQLLSGRDYAAHDPIAQQMVNFTYVIGDAVTRECVLVDPCYAVNELLDIVEADGMTVTGVLATHFHADHIGGKLSIVNDCYSACLFFRMGGHFTRLGLAAKIAVKKMFKARLDGQAGE